MRGASSTLTLPKAEDMAFGIVVSEREAEISSLMLESAVRTLREAGCLEHNIHIKYVPAPFNLAMAAQFFAEYTDVDSVILLGSYRVGDADESIVGSLVQNVLQIQMHWNMPCAWGVMPIGEHINTYEIGERGVSAAVEALNMVKHQVDMEAASPNAAADKKSLN